MKFFGLFPKTTPKPAPAAHLELEPIEPRVARPVADFHAPTFEAGTQLAPVEDPKVKKGMQALPSYAKTAKPSDAVLTREDRQLASTNIETYRRGASTRAVLRDFVASMPDLSATVSAYARTAITDKYVAVARDLDGKFNKEATAVLQQLLVRFDVLGDYKDGFCGIGSMRSNSESLSKELLTYGCCALELVLDKARLPRKLQPISTVNIEFMSDGESLFPRQNLAGTITDLDIATFFYTALDQDLTQPYAASPLEAAIQPVLFAQEFMNDLRKIVKRAIHPRLDMVIVWERFKESLPSDAAHDSKVLRDYMNTFIADLTALVNGLQPEDAMVHFDSVEPSYLNNGNTTTNQDYKVLADLVDAKVSTGAKAMPSILGHGSGSQNVASTESLLFTKNAAGMVQLKLNEIYSRALTLAVRLFGFDVYVEFRYASIDLRPESELESFRTMKKDRVLHLLSLGFTSDEEASLDLTGSLPPATFTPLSGTGFYQPQSAGASNGNPDSNTSTSSGQGSATNRTLKPKTPQGAKN